MQRCEVNTPSTVRFAKHSNPITIEKKKEEKRREKKEADFSLSNIYLTCSFSFPNPSEKREQATSFWRSRSDVLPVMNFVTCCVLI